MAKEWLPQDRNSFPLLPLPLPEVLRNGNMAKSAAPASINWMLRKLIESLDETNFLSGFIQWIKITWVTRLDWCQSCRIHLP